MLKFLLSALAVWRLSSLLVREDGPLDVFLKIRSKAGVQFDEYSNPKVTSVWSGILSCVWCCSVWVAFAVALIDRPGNFFEYFKRAMALSALTIFVDEVLQRITMKNGL